MKFEKVYLQPEVDALKKEVRRLENDKYELEQELEGIKGHLKALLEFVNGE